MHTYVFLDVETTGLDGQTERVIEIYMLRVRQDGSYEEFASFMDPERPIPAKITEITGITAAEVTGAPTEAQLAPRIRSFIAEGTVVAHNLAFDLQFLQAMFRRQGLPTIRRRGVDTLKLSRTVYPRLCIYPEGGGSHRLKNLMYHFGLDDGFANTHRAKDDVLLLVQVYRSLQAVADGVYPTSFPTAVTHGCPTCGRAMHVIADGNGCPVLHCQRPKGCGTTADVSQP